MTIPDLQSGQWDELWLGSAGELVKFPGIWSVSGSGIQRKIDEKNAKGNSKAKIKDEGDKAGKITLEGILWSNELVEEFERLLAMVHPRQTGGPKSPLDIYHPLTELLGIKQLYVHGIPVPRHDKKQGILTVRFDVTEWIPEPKKDKKGKGGGGGGINAKSLADLGINTEEWDNLTEAERQMLLKQKLANPDANNMEHMADDETVGTMMSDKSSSADALA